ncbi:protein NDR1-like [Phalaenopsis equestris]|uniref:protein NDR1-like n=1 Tax=Phalaenopsis equestris TaxID=78828 RepID=UPI0009E24229|nr:protein NDR1-like [Phalaenopsis equestris]
MSESRGLCNCCAKFLISAGLTALVLWISFRFIKPRYYLVSFSLPTANSSSLVASFQLEIENKNRQIGIYHDDIALDLFAGPNLSSPLSHFVVPAFYQGHLKTAEKPGNFSIISGRNLTKFAVESVFRVSANSAFRFKVLGWKSRHHAVSVAGEVEVDSDGKKTAKKGIRLSSSCTAIVPPVVPGCVFLYAMVLLWL